MQEKAFQGSDYDDVDDGEILIGVLVTLFCFAIPIAFIIGIKKLKRKSQRKKAEVLPKVRLFPGYSQRRQSKRHLCSGENV